MTPSTPPNLLTLPRELRDNIYGRVSKSLTLSWEYEQKCLIAPEYKDILYKTAEVTVHNMPNTDVLLTHSRLHDEYKETADSSTPLAVTISTDVFSDPFLPRGTSAEEHAATQVRLDGIFAHARHATLLLEMGVAYHPGESLSDRLEREQFEARHRWYIDGLITLVLRKMPRLRELRIAFEQMQNPKPTSTWQQIWGALPDAELETAVAKQVPRDTCLHTQRLVAHTGEWQQSKPLPFDNHALMVERQHRALAAENEKGATTFTLQQRGEGFRVGFARVEPYRKHMFFDATATYVDDDGVAVTLEHEVHWHAAFMYTKDEDEVRRKIRYWDYLDDIKEEWPRCDYPEQVLSNMEKVKGNAEVMARWPGEFVRWEEKRGVEEVKTWFE